MSARTTTEGSTRLGLTLRSVLLRPEDGFEASFETAEERAQGGVVPDEGYAPTVLTALGGAALMGTWLKVGGLTGQREVAVSDFSWIDLVLAMVLGALLALVAMFLWGRIGPATFRGLHATTSRRDLRIVWGASWLPQVLGLVILVPLDLLIVGPRSFATERLADSLATAWAAFSIAIAVVLVMWSLYLFVKGNEVASGTRSIRLAAGLVVGALCLAVMVAGFIAGALALSETLT